MNSEFIIGKYTLESLTAGMYTSPLDMYREYIQNAVDSFDEMKVDSQADLQKQCVNIAIIPEEKSILIHDNGAGIQADLAVSKLLDIGNSQKDHNITRGFRGIGRLAGLSYCRKLIFKTSIWGEQISTEVIFDAELLKKLLAPGNLSANSIEDVINQITTIQIKEEKKSIHYFEVKLEGVFEETGLIDIAKVREYLIQHAPIPFSEDFKWAGPVVEKMKIRGFEIPEYFISLNGEKLYKPYRDTFVSDRVKKIEDHIQDIHIEAFYRGTKLTALLWYAQTNFFGTVLDNMIKGIRIRQGNILVGDKGSCSHYFTEERFNGWMVGELYVIDQEIIVNARRDGFERNSAYFELENSLKNWAVNISKNIRHISYTRSLSDEKRAITEAETLEDIGDENDLLSEGPQYIKSLGESDIIDQPESDELAESDFFIKLESLFDQKKAQTKYGALNVNNKLTVEQRKVLERVFDIVAQEFSSELANQFVYTIAKNF